MWRSSDETENMRRFFDDDNFGEEANEDTFDWSSEEDEDQHRPSNQEEPDEGAENDASKGSSDEGLDEMANDVYEVFSDDEDSRASEFRGPDYLVYMHYANLAMLQKSAEHCRSCHALTQSLRPHNKDFEEFSEQAQELEAQRLQKLQNNGFRAQLAVLDEDESDPNLDAALQMQVGVSRNYETFWRVAPSLSPEKNGEGRLVLSVEDMGLDYEFIQSAKLDVFCKPTESSDSGHLESEMTFLASPGECEVTCSQFFVQVLTSES